MQNFYLLFSLSTGLIGFTISNFNSCGHFISLIPGIVSNCHLLHGAAGNVIVLQPTKTAMTFCDIDLDRWIDVPASCSDMGCGQPKNHHAVSKQFVSNFLDLHGFRTLSHLSSCIGYGDGTFSIFLGSVHRPIPVRCNWSVFARKIHSTSEFAKIVLSKCVDVCVNHLKRGKTSKSAGGRSIMVSLLPTKTLTIDCDTGLGQSGVPASL